MLRGHNPTYRTKHCRTLKKEAEKHKKTRKNGDRKKSKRVYTSTNEEIHALAAFSKEATAKENLNGLLENFENMSMSRDKKDK